MERRTYQFDEFLVDPVRRVLWRDGEPVPVTPKALSLLLVLLERPGEVVDKAELFQRVWPDSRVTEANLTQNVSFLRKALGERANDRRYVVTVPGQGYSFVGQVVESSGPSTAEIAILPPAPPEPPPEAEPEAPRAEAAPSGVLPAAEPPPSEPFPAEALPAEAQFAAMPPASPASQSSPARLRGVAIAFVLAFLAMLGAAGVWLTSRGAPAPPPAPEKNAGAGELRGGTGRGSSRPVVAVLGFKNLSGTKTSQWLAPALSEILTTELAAGSSVRMVSGENVARARQVLSLPYSEGGEGYDLRRLRSFLGADLVVVGSYSCIGGEDPQIRLNLRVLKVPEGTALASLSKTGTESDLFDLVAKTGDDLRRALGLEDLSPEEARQVAAQHPASPEAARLYTQGLARMRTFDFLAARDLLAQAAEADPGSAQIHSALSQAWTELGYDARALAEAGKARELSSLLSREEKLQLEAQFYTAGRQWGKAGEIYRSLWTFFPDDLEYGLRLAHALAQAGRGREAADTLAALRKLPRPASDDPRIDLEEAFNSRSMSDMITARRSAVVAAAKGRNSGERLVVAQALLLQGSVPLFTGYPRDALALFREARGIYDSVGYRWGSAMAAAHIGLSLYRNGDLAAAEKANLEAVDISRQIGNVTGMAAGLGNLGFLYQSQGDLNRARDFLDRSRVPLAEIDDPLLTGRILCSLATVRLLQGDLEAARQGSEEVLALTRRTGNRSDEARALGNLGVLLAARGNLKEARAYFDKALAILHAVNDPSFAIPVLVNAADVLARLGEAAAARRQVEQELAAARQAGSRLGTARLLGALAGLSLRAGDLPAARAQAGEQLRIAREIGARDLTAGALQSLGKAALAAGDLRGARASLEESLLASESGGETLLSMATRLDLAHLFLALGKPEEASRLARVVADWYGPREIRAEEARALSLLAEALQQQGRFAESRQAAARARSQAEQSDDLQMRLEISARLSALEAVRRAS